VSPSSPTILASGQLTRSGDTISVELIQPDSMPAAVRIVWPTAPTITTLTLQRSGQHSHASTR
jgi:hypothetical protein